MRNKGFICIVSLLFIILSTSVVFADDWYQQYGSFFTVYNIENGEELFSTARVVTKGDKYISGDNKMYEVIRVNKNQKRAYAEFVKDIVLPKVDEGALARIVEALNRPEGLRALLAQAQDEERKIGIYATHSAESYVPTDGTESEEGGGGILKVAERLHESFQNHGVNSVFDNTNHVPHDAGAYKRSRRTAVQLMRDHGLNTLVDVHRDAIPAEKYITDINGEPATKVRLVIGRGNQNFKANEELAWKIKSVADNMYPELIKDIFYAQGSYNQDLTPQAMLVEMGTYGHKRERAEKSAGLLSEVLTTALFGGVIQDAEGGETEEVKPQTQSNAGMGSGIIVLLLVIGGGGLAFLFLSSGGKEWRSKISNFKEEFNSFLGRRRKK